MASSFSGRVFAALVICLMLPAHGEVLATDQWLCDGGDVDSANVGPCFATADGPTRCSCRECDDSCGLWDNVSIFVGLEGSKQPQDFGINANFGGRFALNWGFPLVPPLRPGGPTRHVDQCHGKCRAGIRTHRRHYRAHSEFHNRRTLSADRMRAALGRRI